MTPNWWKWANRIQVPMLLCLFLWTGLAKDRPLGRGSIILSDAEGYYLYLPATFVYEGWAVNNFGVGMPMQSCCAVNEQGLIQTRYTYGVAALQAPFFLLADRFARWKYGPGTPAPISFSHLPDREADRNVIWREWSPDRGQVTGFSEPYSISVIIAAALYASLGLGMLRSTLSVRFGHQAAHVTTLLIALGTNLYYYASSEPGMSHAYSFFLFAAFLWLLPQWLQKPRLVRSIGLGVCLGLIALIRPTNLMLAALFIGWEVYDLPQFRQRLTVLIPAWPHFLLMAAIFMLLAIPQMSYWKTAWGQWLVWSYAGEGFSNALHPPVHKVLFSYQNGLFMYTPLALAMVIAIPIAWHRKVASAPVMAMLFLLATYTFASWWAWWFGAAFGHRCYVEFYALLALPLAAMVKLLWESRRPWVWYLAAGVMVFLILANLHMSNLYNPPWDGPDWRWENYLGIWARLF